MPKQLALLRLRNICPAFGFDAALEVEVPADDRLTLRWRKDGTEAELTADLTRWDFDIRVNGRKVLA